MNDLKDKIQKILKDPLARGSAILFVGSTGVNVLSYIYNLVIGRMLGVEQYGEYLSLVTIVYLLSIPFNTVHTIVIKYVSQLRARNEPEKIKQLLIMLTKYTVIVSGTISLCIIALSPLIASLLKVDNYPAIVLMGVLFTVFTVSAIVTFAFNGLEKFALGTALTGLGVLSRIIISVLVIALGFAVAGVFGALIIGNVIAYIVSWYFLNKYIDQRSHKKSLGAKAWSFLNKLFKKTGKELDELKAEIWKFTLPATTALIGIAAITQVDIILVKIFFSSYEAGIYGSLAIIGKVIPFLTVPLLSALFPELVQRVTKNQNFLKPFYAIIGIISVATFSLSVFYFLFPNFVILSFFGDNYLNAAPYIGLFGLFQSVFTIMNAYVMFFLAIGKTKLAAQSIIAAVLQIVGISLFHSSLQQVIFVSIIICGLFSIYYTFCTLQLAYSTNKAGYERKESNST